MIIIDGTTGEGGGQILRTSLSLSMITGQPIQIKKIRGKRKKPGIMRQHLGCIKAAVRISNGYAEGAELGNDTLTFHPGPVQPGTYRFAIGSAGSSMLLFQTILPALIRLEEPTTIQLEGGTHNPLAPSWEFLKNSFLPQLRKMGCAVEANLEVPGFFPAGGGKWSATIYPTKQLIPIHLESPGKLIKRKAVLIYSDIPEFVKDRQIDLLRKELSWGPDHFNVVEYEATCPGNMISLQLQYDDASHVFDSLGERGRSSEKVIARAFNGMKKQIDSKTPVCRFLADQLLLPMALAGKGSYQTRKLSLHTKTNMEIIQEFLDVRFSVTQLKEDVFKVEVAPP